MADRGTSKKKPAKETAWQGDEFKKNEQKRLKASGVEYITTGRGTTKIPVKDVKNTKKSKTKGKKIVSGRGTGTRIL